MLSTKKIALSLLVTSAVFFSFSNVSDRYGMGLQTVVIDAGHGGKDPGTGQGKEKRHALDIALRLGRKIEKSMPDVKVVYTRKSDIFIPLNERAAIANKSQADLFISIHCNAFTSSNASGTETYVMGLHKSEANLNLAKRENSVILLEENYQKSYKGFNPNSPLAHIMLANYQSAFMKQSMEFAIKVENHFVNNGHKSRGVKQAGFLVIWETTMPSVLIETGYLSNPRDEKKLDSASGRESLANSIYTAFKSYKNDVDANI